LNRSGVLKRIHRIAMRRIKKRMETMRRGLRMGLKKVKKR